MIYERKKHHDPLLQKAMELSGREGNIPPAEMLLLAIRAQAGDHQAMDRLVVSNLRMCLRHANRKKGLGVELLDLFNEAVIGFTKGVMKYDAERGASLLACAGWWVDAELWNAVAEQSRTVALTRRTVDVWIKVRDFIQDEKWEGRYPGISQIAEATGSSEKMVRSILCHQYGAESLNRRFAGADGNDSELIDMVGSYDDLGEWVHDDESEWINRLIDDNLTEREQLVVRGYYFDNLGYVKLGEMIGRTKERARQLTMKATAKLRVAMSESGEGLTDSDRVDLLRTFHKGASE